MNLSVGRRAGKLLPVFVAWVGSSKASPRKLASCVMTSGQRWEEGGMGEDGRKKRSSLPHWMGATV